MNISVIIPVYKNVPEFVANLKHNIPYLKGCQIIVVNDDPTLSISTEMSTFPEVTLIENEKNLGFGVTVNKGVRNASRDYVMLLNTDVLLLDDSYKKALVHFGNENIFAVSFAQKEKNGEIVGKNKIYWQKGFFQHSKATDMETGITAWAEGGSSVIDKKKYDELHGFDPIYSPFYWEDIDLSYRAWKKGYAVLFDADILVEHHHESTIGAHFSRKSINTTAYRNQLFFIWGNIGEIKLLVDHFFHLKWMLFISLLKLDFVFISGYFQAVAKLAAVKKKRSKINSKYSDYEILAKFTQ